MTLRGGSRVRVSTVDDEGIPIVRYGTVGADHRGDGPVVVVYDDLAGSDLVDVSEIVSVDYDSIELRFRGTDLAHDVELRRGLAAMWRAEADIAGLALHALFPLGDDGSGVPDGGTSWTLAEFTVHGTTHIVRATLDAHDPTTVVVRADRMNRWDGYY